MIDEFLTTEADWTLPITVTVEEDLTLDALALAVGTEDQPTGDWLPEASASVEITRVSTTVVSLALYVGSVDAVLPAADYWLWLRITNGGQIKMLRLRRFAVREAV